MRSLPRLQSTLSCVLHEAEVRRVWRCPIRELASNALCPSAGPAQLRTKVADGWICRDASFLSFPSLISDSFSLKLNRLLLPEAQVRSSVQRAGLMQEYKCDKTLDVQQRSSSCDPMLWSVDPTSGSGETPLDVKGSQRSDLLLAAEPRNVRSGGQAGLLPSPASQLCKRNAFNPNFIFLFLYLLSIFSPSQSSSDRCELRDRAMTILGLMMMISEIL